jgi:hypothetical protein
MRCFPLLYEDFLSLLELVASPLSLPFLFIPLSSNPPKDLQDLGTYRFVWLLQTV